MIWIICFIVTIVLAVLGVGVWALIGDRKMEDFITKIMNSIFRIKGF